jgi:hypothetical protein
MQFAAIQSGCQSEPREFEKQIVKAVRIDFSDCLPIPGKEPVTARLEMRFLARRSAKAR